MGHALAIVVERDVFSGGAVTPAEIDQANRILKVLPNCVREAEIQFVEYAGSDFVSSGDDIQYPHVWLSGETDDPADWSLVVEMKGNDGYGCHIEFHADKFKTIWAGN